MAGGGCNGARNGIGAVVTAWFALFGLQLLPSVRTARLPGARLAGALTYPVYLIHAHLGYMVISRFADNGNKWLVTGLTVAGVLVIAYAIHAGIEVRLKPVWERLFEALAQRIACFSRRALARVPRG